MRQKNEATEKENKEKKRKIYQGQDTYNVLNPKTRSYLSLYPRAIMWSRAGPVPIHLMGTPPISRSMNSM